jgi:hypothetical protein
LLGSSTLDAYGNFTSSDPQRVNTVVNQCVKPVSLTDEEIKELEGVSSLFPHVRIIFTDWNLQGDEKFQEFDQIWHETFTIFITKFRVKSSSKAKDPTKYRPLQQNIKAILNNKGLKCLASDAEIKEVSALDLWLHYANHVFQHSLPINLKRLLPTELSEQKPCAKPH